MLEEGGSLRQNAWIQKLEWDSSIQEYIQRKVLTDDSLSNELLEASYMAGQNNA